jgi:hypothetical protein
MHPRVAEPGLIRGHRRADGNIEVIVGSQPTRD